MTSQNILQYTHRDQYTDLIVYISESRTRYEGKASICLLRLTSFILHLFSCRCKRLCQSFKTLNTCCGTYVTSNTFFCVGEVPFQTLHRPLARYLSP